MPPTAAVVTIGTELVEGARVDTNTAEIARALAPRGFSVLETVSVGDDVALLAEELARLTHCRDLIVTTGGLGPTHDDITREAASRALELELVLDPRLAGMLVAVQKRHADPAAAERVLVQAMVFPGAEVIDFTTGTAPGLVVRAASGATLALLPGPPSEMRPMLAALLERYELVFSEPRLLGVVGLSESDAQVRVERAIGPIDGVGFTILARPGDVRVILTDKGCGRVGLDMAADMAALALGEHCYAADASTLAEVVIREAAARGLTIALAESCTGGMVAAALTDVPGSSDVLIGGVVAYSNLAKTRLLGVPAELIDVHGAVSAECVEAMALGARNAFDQADLAVAVSGIAGPGGGSADKPVGTVWFGVLSSRLAPEAAGTQAATQSVQFRRTLPPTSREAVRARATSIALDCLRRATLGMDLRA